MNTSARLQMDFFAQDTLTVARMLIGQRLVREEEGKYLTAIICETEAYIGTEDLGCHAKSGRTARNASMWSSPGLLYVYFTYGMHWMLNFVTEKEGFPAAVLLRGVFPREGLEVMRIRRKNRPDRILTDGPAKFCQAFNINGSFDGVSCVAADSPLYIEPLPQVDSSLVSTSPRIGLQNVPEPWRSKPWRFLIPASAVEDRH